MVFQLRALGSPKHIIMVKNQREDSIESLCLVCVPAAKVTILIIWQADVISGLLLTLLSIKNTITWWFQCCLSSYSPTCSVILFWYPFYSVAFSTHRLSQHWDNTMSTSFLLSLKPTSLCSLSSLLPYPSSISILCAQIYLCLIFSAFSYKILFVVFLPLNVVRNEPIHYNPQQFPYTWCIKI